MPPPFVGSVCGVKLERHAIEYRGRRSRVLLAALCETISATSAIL